MQSLEQQTQYLPLANTGQLIWLAGVWLGSLLHCPVATAQPLAIVPYIFIKSANLTQIVLSVCCTFHDIFLFLELSPKCPLRCIDNEERQGTCLLLMADG